MKRWIAIALCLLINGVSLSHLRAQKQHVSGYLGVGVGSITSDRMRDLKLKDNHGVVILNIGPDTPAAKAGLKESDVIVEFNGQPVDDVDRFKRLVRDAAPNHKVNIRVIRGGVSQTLTATIASRTILNGEDIMPVVPMPPMPPMPQMPRTPWDDQAQLPSMLMPPMPESVFSWRQASIGIEAEALRGQLAEYFGVKEGVLVRSVLHNSPAERAGLKAGDVIVRVVDNNVRTPQEVSSEVATLVNSKSPVSFGVVRNRKETSLSLKF